MMALQVRRSSLLEGMQKLPCRRTAADPALLKTFLSIWVISLEEGVPKVAQRPLENRMRYLACRSWPGPGRQTEVSGGQAESDSAGYVRGPLLDQLRRREQVATRGVHGVSFG